MERANQIFEVEIKSKAIIKEGKKSLITYLRGGTDEQIIMNVKGMYPQYFNSKDYPHIDITPISDVEYQERVEKNMAIQKRVLMKEQGDFLQ